MTWSVDHQCWSCCMPGCDDLAKFEDATAAVNNIEHHGTGILRLDCSKHQPRIQVSNMVRYVPASGEHVGKPMPAVVMETHGGHKLDLAVITGKSTDGSMWLVPINDVPYSAKNELGTWHHVPK